MDPIKREEIWNEEGINEGEGINKRERELLLFCEKKYQKRKDMKWEREIWSLFKTNLMRV